MIAISKDSSYRSIKEKLQNSKNTNLKSTRRKRIVHGYEDITEKFLYYFRWILSPMYIVLMVVLFFILWKFLSDVWSFIWIAGSLNTHEFIIRVLELLDLTLMGNLVLIVAFSGYENFVSKIDVAEQDERDRPTWMGRLDFSGLKLKIIGSVVAISLIELLQDFLNATSGIDPNVVFWRIMLHLTFVFTGLVFAGMEILSEKRHEMKNRDELAETEF